MERTSLMDTNKFSVLKNTGTFPVHKSDNFQLIFNLIHFRLILSSATRIIMKLLLPFSPRG